jgi:protein TonB
MKIIFKQSLLALLFCFSGTLLFSQVNMTADIPNRDPNDPVYTYVEKMPQLPGGKERLKQYMDYYPYPPCGLEKNIQGYVILQFIVEKNGKLSDVKVVRSPDQCLSDAALDYLNHWPTWEPAKVKDEDVSCLFTVPINYNIEKYNKRPK